MFSQTLNCILSFSILCAVSWLVAADVLRLRDPLDRAVGAFVCGASFIVIALEISSPYFFAPVLPLEYFAFFALVLYHHFGKKKNDVETATGSSREAGHSPVISLPIKILIAVACAVFFANFVFALVTPPAPTDAFLDHLVFPAEWLRAAHITLVQTLSPDQATTYYPGNGELLYLRLMMPLHDDLLAGLLEPLSLVFAALACVRIGLRAGLDRNAAFGAAALAVMAPGVINLTQQFGVDMFFAASLLCSTAFLLPADESENTYAEIIVAGLAAGLAVGTKYVGVPFAVLLIPLLLIKRKRMSRPVAVVLFSAAAAATCGYWYIRNIILTGSPFYPMGFDIGGIEFFRGAFNRSAMFNSYLHIPVQDVSYLGSIISGLIAGKWLLAAAALLFVAGALTAKNTISRVVAVILILSVAAAGFISYSGTGVLAAAVPFLPLLAAAAYAIIISAVMRDRPRRLHYTLWLAPLFILFYWYVNPYNTANNYRFTIPAVFIAFVALAAVVGARERRWNHWAIASLAVPALAANYVSLSRISRFFHDAVSNAPTDAWYNLGMRTGIFAALVFAASALAVWASRARRRTVAAAFVLLALAATGAFLNTKKHFMDEGRYKWYAGHYLAQGWSWLEAAIRVPATIAYAGNCSPYGLYGNGFKNTVVYINTDGRTGRIFHDYEIGARKAAAYAPPTESVGLNYIFRGNRDYDRWRQALRRERVDLLFVSREFYRGVISDPVELTWAVENPRDFKLAYHRGDVFIFMLLDHRRSAP